MGEKIVIPTPFLNPSLDWDMSLEGNKSQNSDGFVMLKYNDGASNHFSFAITTNKPFLYDNIMARSSNINMLPQDNITYNCQILRYSEYQYQASMGGVWNEARDKIRDCDTVVVTRTKSHINFKFFDMTIYSGIYGSMTQKMTLKPAIVGGVKGYYDTMHAVLYPIVWN